MIVSTKKTIIISLLLLFAVVGVVAFVKYISQKERTIASITQQFIQAQKAAHYYKAQDSTNHERIVQVSLTKEASDILYKKEKDSIVKTLNLRNAKQIKDILKMDIDKSGTIHATATPIVIHDTTFWVSEYQDDHISIKDTVGSGFNRLSYNVHVDAKVVTMKKRKWFLAPWEYYIDAYSTDTSVHISGLQNIHIDNEISRFSVGAFVGYDILNKKPGIGLSLNYSIIRFKKRKK